MPGNPISIPTPVAIAVGSGIRVDNDIPLNAGATYTVIANNGYVGAAYSFASGTGGVAASDSAGALPGIGKIPGVGGVTTTYYVGAAGSSAFATPNSCDITNLTIASTGAALANTTAATADAAKVIVSDALGNKICTDIAVTTLAGPSATFGVDKIAPIAVATTANSGAAASTGYTTGSAKNFSFVINDSGSANYSATQPLVGTLVRNFTITQASDCQLGTYNNTNKTCVAAPITVASFGTPPNAGGSVSMTNGTAGTANSNAYYTITVTPVDLAGNVGAPVTRIAAYDTIAPVVAAPASAAVTPLGSVTLTGAATDNLDLATAKGDLLYATAPLPIAGPAATSFGTLFDPTLVKSATASATIANVYRGLQSTTAGIIQGNTAPPAGTLTVTDVGTNSFTSPSAPITTTSAAANILTTSSITFAVTPTSAAPATSQTSTTLTVNLSGPAADITFQSQPFAQVDVYKQVGSELVLVASIQQTINTYTSATVGLTHFYTYVLTGLPLTAAATNNFYVVGASASGDAVISPVVTVTNP